MLDPAVRPDRGRAVVGRLLGWQWLDEFMPFFGVYALLFADRGLTEAQISGLFIVWSLVAIIAEVPSGAWADVVPRRLLLAAGALLYGCCFASWVLWPTGWGFVLGFVLWGVSGALSSGTFQAFAYDELSAIGRPDAYARVIGWGYSLALAAVTLATLLATPLYALGGYPLVGWVSVAVCGAQFLLVLSMPETPRTISASAAGELAETEELPSVQPLASVPVRAGAAWATWWTTLREGLRVCRRDVVVRGGVLASALLMGLLAFDEYFGLLFREQGVSTVAIPVLLTAVAGAQALGAVLAERAGQWSPRTAGVVLGVAAALLAVGSLSGHPAGVVGIAAGYGAMTLLIVVSEVRLQQVAPAQVRATVTSASNMVAEVLGIAVYLVFVLVDAPVSLLIGVLAGVLVLGGVALARWLPPVEPGPAPPVSST